MEVLFLINTKKYGYHSRIIKDFTEAVCDNYLDANCRIIDFAEATPLHELYNQIISNKSDLIITFDYSGFELTTEGDTLSLNTVPAKMAHILFQNIDRYRLEISYRQNFSMFTCISNNDDINNWKNVSENICNIEKFPELNIASDTEEVHISNKGNINKWINDFMKKLRIEG